MIANVGVGGVGDQRLHLRIEVALKVRDVQIATCVGGIDALEDGEDVGSLEGDPTVAFNSHSYAFLGGVTARLFHGFRGPLHPLCVGGTLRELASEHAEVRR